MADIPHWYYVRQRAQAAGLGPGHERLYLLIKHYHCARRWRGRVYRSVGLDCYLYLIMQNGTVINRRPQHDAEA